MKKFGGFPARMQFTPVPDLFFSALLTQISDINELKVSLFIFKTLYQKRGSLRFTTYSELLGTKSLISSLREGDKSPQSVLRAALEAAAGRGTILRLAMDRNGSGQDIYFLNTEANREAMAKIQSGELNLGELKVEAPPEVKAAEQPDIFTLYEENIGMLTPLIADELRDAEKTYPAPWIRDAIKEAVESNALKWRYIAAILERWSSEGRNDGASRRDYKKADPDKYIRGKYGHMVRR